MVLGIALALACLIVSATVNAEVVAAERTYVIENARLIPMTREVILDDTLVVIQGDRISAICHASADCAPEDAQRIDGRGRYVLPALADMHNHFGGVAFDGRDETRIRTRNQNLRQYVMFGVMTVRDPAGNRQMLATRDEIDSGKLFGPRIYTSRGVMDGDPPLFPGPPSFTSAEAAAEFVAQTAAERYDFVKVYSALSPDVFDAVMEAARSAGMTVAAHVPMRVPIEHALEKGLRSIEHLTGYDVACAAPAVQLQPTVRDIYQGWAWCTPDRIRQLAETTARYRVWNVPTLALWDNTVIELLGNVRASAEQRAFEHPLLPMGLAWLYTIYGPRERAGLAGTRPVRLALVKALSDAGAPILVGTDVSAAGLTVHSEMSLLVEAGLSTYKALAAATSEPARYLRQEGNFGMLVEGARADILLLDANPLEDIRNTRSIAGLMHRGTWWTKDMIDAELDALQREYAEDAALIEQLGWKKIGQIISSQAQPSDR